MMGKVFSYIRRPFINYAVEERASRVLDKAAKSKPTKAPLYPTEEKVLKQIQREHPELIEKIKAKNDKLDGYLKQVKVKTELLPSEQNPSLTAGSASSSKVLPQERIPFTETEFGLPELPDDKVPVGKLSFRQAMEIFRKIPNDSSSNSQDISEAKKFAVERYRLNEQQATLLLQYFRPFLLSKDVEDVLVRPSKVEELKDPIISTGRMLQEAAERTVLGKTMKKQFLDEQAEQFKKLKHDSQSKNDNAVTEELAKRDK